MATGVEIVACSASVYDLLLEEDLLSIINRPTSPVSISSLPILTSPPPSWLLIT